MSFVFALRNYNAFSEGYATEMFFVLVWFCFYFFFFGEANHFVNSNVSGDSGYIPYIALLHQLYANKMNYRNVTMLIRYWGNVGFM